jgi:hypothetical protein
MTASHTTATRPSARRFWPAVLSALTIALALAPFAQAERAQLQSPKLGTKEVPGGQIEGACGVAVSGELIYVSDYYHHDIDVFDLNSGAYQSRIAGNPLDGPCALATSAEALYAADWHGAVSRLLPSTLGFGSPKSNSTGVAVDPASGNVYVDERTHVAVYEPSGAAVLDGGGDPLLIGSGTLGDAYGVAVFAGKVYVPDAADGTVKVYEPTVDPVNPVRLVDGAAALGGGFNSLVDATVAIDPSNEHMLVVDNLQPGFEHPEAAIYEFGAAGELLGRLGAKIIDGEPSGLAFAGGRLYASSGNDEEANVVVFGPYVATSSLAAAPAPTPPAAVPLGSGGQAASLDSAAPRAARKGPSASTSEVVQRGDLRVSFDGKLSPHALPRREAAPVRVAVAAKIASTDDSTPPQLRRISIAINRYGRFTPQGLPLCPLREIQPSTTASALAACRASLVGEGRFSAKILFDQQAPFPADGKVYAFNGRLDGRPAIFAHVYGTDPVPTSFTLPFKIEPSKGTFGTTLRTALPSVIGSSGYITGLSLTLGRSFTFRGKRRSYLSASCPAPDGFPGAVFPFAKASFGFQGAPTLSSTVTRSCGVRR